MDDDVNVFIHVARKNVILHGGEKKRVVSGFAGDTQREEIASLVRVCQWFAV